MGKKKTGVVTVVGLAAAMSATPSLGATTVQVDDEATQRGFNSFFSGEGRLDSVTLFVEVLDKARDWQLSVPSSEPTTRQVSWTADGTYAGQVINFAGPSSSFVLPIFGSAAQTVALTPVSEFIAYGNFTTVLAGSALFQLNPANFVVSSFDDSFRNIIVTGNDLGYYGPGTDTTFSIAGPHSIYQIEGSCGGFQTGDDFCGNVRYTLTYNYTPADELAPAVPEPGTWAMMLLGFGAVGFSLRRRRLAVMQAAQVPTGSSML